MAEQNLNIASTPKITRNLNSSELGVAKKPPQAVELEEAVLGAMMISKKGLNESIEILEEEFFYRPQHQHIFAAIFTLFNNAEPIDIFTVSEQLKKDGKFDSVGGDLYLISLTEKITSSAHIEHHARIIQEKYVQRKLIEISSQIIENAYDDTADIFKLLDQTETEIFKVTEGVLNSEYKDAKSLVMEAVAQIEKRKGQQGLSGVPTGFREVDELTSGLNPSDLIILAARPGMGKTAFVLSMARNMAVQHKVPVAVFSLEMPSVQLITRLIVGETGLDNDKIKKGTLSADEWNHLYAKVKTLENAPLFIDDTPGLNIFDLRAKCRRLVAQHDVKVVIIDYLQLMTSKNSTGGNREQEISTISRGLKAIAKELNVPVIALSQLSREVEKRPNKRPQLSDLRESGAIEQDADIVSFIYRPEYYKIDTWDDEEQTPCAGQAEFIVAKHRNGGLKNIRLKFVAHQAKFEDLVEDSFSVPMVFESKMNSPESQMPELPVSDPKDSFGLDDDYDTPPSSDGADGFSQGPDYDTTNLPF
ncbi:replicative DNA helicase [Ornithobacterium rhinotracheale]